MRAQLLEPSLQSCKAQETVGRCKTTRLQEKNESSFEGNKFYFASVWFYFQASVFVSDKYR